MARTYDLTGGLQLKETKTSSGSLTGSRTEEQNPSRHAIVKQRSSNNLSKKEASEKLKNMNSRLLTIPFRQKHISQQTEDTQKD